MKKFNKYLFKKLGLITNENLIFLEKNLKEEFTSLKEENDKLRKNFKLEYLTTLKKTNENLKSLEKGLAVIQANNLVSDLKNIIINKNFSDGEVSFNKDQYLKNTETSDNLEVLNKKKFSTNLEIMKNAVEHLSQQNLQLKKNFEILARLSKEHGKNLEKIFEENKDFKNNFYQLENKNKEFNLDNMSLLAELNIANVKYNKFKRLSIVGFFILMGTFVWSFAKYNLLEHRLAKSVPITESTSITSDKFIALQKEITLLKEKIVEATPDAENINIMSNEFATLQEEIASLKEKIVKVTPNTENINIMSNEFATLQEEIASLKEKIVKVTPNTENINIMSNEFATLQEEIASLKEKIVKVTPNTENISIVFDELTALQKEITLLKNTKEELIKKIDTVEKKVESTVLKVKPSLETTKKNVIKKKYSQDDIYTKLLELGFRGENAISEFQRKKGLKPTGIADERTLALMGLL